MCSGLRSSTDHSVRISADHAFFGGLTNMSPDMSSPFFSPTNFIDKANDDGCAGAARNVVGQTAALARACIGYWPVQADLCAGVLVKRKAPLALLSFLRLCAGIDNGDDAVSILLLWRRRFRRGGLHWQIHNLWPLDIHARYQALGMVGLLLLCASASLEKREEREVVDNSLNGVNACHVIQTRRCNVQSNA